MIKEIGTNDNVLFYTSTENRLSSKVSLGEVVKAAVVANLENNRAVILLKGEKVLAYTPLKLSEGDEILLKIIRVNPYPIMELLSEVQPSVNASIQDSLKKMFNEFSFAKTLDEIRQMMEMGSGLQKEPFSILGKTLELMTLQKNEISDFNKLADFIRDSGLFYESKLKKMIFGVCNEEEILKDIKYLLLKSLELLKSKDGKNISSDTALFGKIQELLDRIEKNQIYNAISTRRYFFHFPFFFTGGIRDIRIDVFLPEKKVVRKDEKKKINIIINLDFMKMGEIRVDTHLDSKKISCFIQVGNEEVARVVKGSLGVLAKMIESMDFKIESLICTLFRKKISEEKSGGKDLTLIQRKTLDVKI